MEFTDIKQHLYKNFKLLKWQLEALLDTPENPK